MAFKGYLNWKLEFRYPFPFSHLEFKGVMRMLMI